jgi:uncharacterized coiled-coil protein SlyX
MPATVSSAASRRSDALQAQIEALSDQIVALNTALNKGLDRLADQLGCYEGRLRVIETNTASSQPVMHERIKNLENKTEEHDRKLVELQKLIAEQAKTVERLMEGMLQMKAIFKWILGILTTIAITVITLLVTGQAEVIFK